MKNKQPHYPMNVGNYPNRINSIPFSRLIKAWAYQVFLPLIKRWNRIEFHFVKPFSKGALLAEIDITKAKNANADGVELEKKIKDFGKTKVFYPDSEVRSFGMFSWLELGEGILKLNNIKIKRCGRN